MSTPLARRMALDILRRCLDHHQDLQAAVDDVLATAAPGPDKGLATELAYGYLRYRGRLDFLLATLLKNPVQTSPILRRILGVAAYELLFLSRVPDYATLDWAVTLVRERLDQTMARVANGVLRNLLRLGRSVRFPEFYDTKTAGQAQFLAAWYSCPLWLAQLWLKSYGKELTENFLQATLDPPPLGLRINQTRPEALELHTSLLPQAVAHSHWGLALAHWPDSAAAAVRNGLATRQSLAAQNIMHTLAASSWPEPILDACAGRGGKSFLLKEMGKDVWASDTNVFRLRQITAEQQRLGLELPIWRAPGQGPFPLRRPPSTVFLDAPCSGLGVLSRRPDIKWKRTQADCTALAGLQKDLLAAAANLLPSGGCLAYVTCTLNVEENEEQIAGFCRAHPEFRLLIQKQTAADSNLAEYFFGAVLRKA
jgi:16S rRNA (cytosine967-C5)-methyltransferase